MGLPSNTHVTNVLNTKEATFRTAQYFTVLALDMSPAANPVRGPSVCDNSSEVIYQCSTTREVLFCK